MTKCGIRAGGPDEQGYHRGLPRGNFESHQRCGLKTRVTTDELSRERVDNLGRHYAVGHGDDGVRGHVVHSQSAPDVVTGGHDDGSVQPHGHLSRVHLLRAVAAGPDSWLTLGVGERAEQERDAGAEPTVNPRLLRSPKEQVGFEGGCSGCSISGPGT